MSEVIYSAINAVMAEIGTIGKEKKSQQGFMYRGIDDVMNALNPALINHKVFAVPEVLEQKREERSTKNGGVLIYSICKIRYTFYAEDGSHIEAVVVGEGMDSGDKATNKAMAIAFKYACFQVFCIPTEEMVKDADARPVDPDTEGYNVAPKKPAGKPVNKPKPQQDKMIDNERIQNLFNECGRTGTGWKGVCATYGLKVFSEMNVTQYKDAMQRFSVIPDKPVENIEPVPVSPPDPATIPPDDMCGLPFN